MVSIKVMPRLVTAPAQVGKRIYGRGKFTAELIGEAADRLKQELPQTRLGKAPGVQLVARVIKEIGEDDVTHMAASVSYYAILSLFPLILGLSVIISLAANSPSQHEEIVDFVVDYLPGSEQFVRDSVDNVAKLRGALGVLSVVGLLWTGSAVFGSITRAVNRAWDIHRNPPFYKNKPKQIAMALGVGVLFILSVGITGFFQWATTIELGGQSVASLLGGTGVAVILKFPAFLITFTMFIGIYKFLPATKTYWRDMILAGVIVTLLFEAGKNLFLWYLENFAEYDQLYGNVASVIVLMIWTYVSAFILLLGAEIASEYSRMRRGVVSEYDEGPLRTDL